MSANILKIEAFSGASGDMFLGALAELSDGYDELRKLPEKLGLKNVEVNVTAVVKTGIACKHIKIIDSNEHSHHHHRHLPDIYKIIDEGDISASAKEIAKKIFLRLGEAEAAVHGTDLNHVHFHEVGAIDSILDIVGAAVLLDRLQVQKTYSTAVRTGRGFVKTAHGKLPVPAPATKLLLQGFPTYPGDTEGEMCTPTGAAILRCLNPEFTIPTLVEEKTGHGPGEKNFDHPNLLRISLCKPAADNRQDQLYVLETNIDDLSGEFLGMDFQEGLFEKGARDFCLTQVIMKKGRPGVVLSVICEEENLAPIAEYIFENTSSIGIRYYPVERMILKRSERELDSGFGKISLKESVLPSGKIKRKAEYESLKKIAGQEKLGMMEISRKINKEMPD